MEEMEIRKITEKAGVTPNDESEVQLFSHSFFLFATPENTVNPP